MSPLIIWSIAAVLYAIFWFWYIGFSRKVTPKEIDTMIKAIQSKGELDQQRLNILRHFFEQDDGQDFVMVNLLELKKPIQDSKGKLETYQKIFLGNLIKRAGHPLLMAIAAGGKIENIECDNDNWRAAAIVRYRRRHDLLELLPDTFGSEHHALKLDSLERTLAFPASPRVLVGGPKIIVPLVLALLAALAHIVVMSGTAS